MNEIFFNWFDSFDCSKDSLIRVLLKFLISIRLRKPNVYFLLPELVIIIHHSPGKHSDHPKKSLTIKNEWNRVLFAILYPMSNAMLVNNTSTVSKNRRKKKTEKWTNHRGTKWEEIEPEPSINSIKNNELLKMATATKRKKKMANN